MPLLTTLQALGAFAVVAAVLLLLFLVRQRARRVVVPSLAPWKAELHRRVNPIWRRLVALALQLIAAGLACAALVAPETPDAQASSAEGPRVAVVDGSASMRAAGRMDAARAVIDAEGMGVILAGDSPALLVEPGARSAARLAGLARLEAGWGQGSVPQAVALAESLGYTPVVLSDGPLPDGVDAELRLVGPAGPDLSVDEVVVTAGPGLPPEYAVTVQVSNHSGAPASPSLRLETGESILGEETLTLEPGQVLRRTYRMEPVEGRWIEARLASADDVLPDNDRAFGLLPGLRRAEVWLVSDGNRYLEDMLRLMPGLRVRRVSSAAWRAAPGDIDLVIFDRVAPSRPPTAAAVYIDPPEGAGPLPPTARVVEPGFVTWDFSHRLLRNVSLRHLSVDEASVLSLPRPARVLASIEEGPAIAVIDQAPRALVIGFDLTRSDLPLTIAFPQLVYNLVMWARQDAVGEAPEPAFTPGGGIPVSPSGPVRVEQLDGEGQQSFAPGISRLTGLTPGVYGVEDAEGARMVVVNADPAEHARGGVGAAVAAASDGPAPGEQETPRFVVLLLAAAAALLVEFLVR
ncbi:MAG: VWA domain-containing protein [Alphaproteobacteria bacterium]|nr:VWA domain-containing protein [Alphaproteobacteria bacterium]